MVDNYYQCYSVSDVSVRFGARLFEFWWFARPLIVIILRVVGGRTFEYIMSFSDALRRVLKPASELVSTFRLKRIEISHRVETGNTSDVQEQRMMYIQTKSLEFSSCFIS